MTRATSSRFVLPPELEATEPPEVTPRPPRRRAHARVDRRAATAPTRAGTSPTWLASRDLVVVNTSATIPAAIDATPPDGRRVVVHLSTELPTGLHLVEVRRPGPTARPCPTRRPRRDDARPRRRRPRAPARPDAAGRCGCGSPRSTCRPAARAPRPLRPADPLPLRARLVADRRLHQRLRPEPGSAEMPSAGRALTAEVVTDLVAHGIVVAPIVLHTGVASLEAHETPYPERYRVPASTARLVNATHAAGGRVVAVGTTVVRALETVADDDGVVHPGGAGPSSSSRPSAACGSSTGCSPGGTSRRPATCGCSRRSPAAGARACLPRGARPGLRYRWHEFGDVHLILPEPRT